MEVLGVVARDSLALTPESRVILPRRLATRPVDFQMVEFPLPPTRRVPCRSTRMWTACDTQADAFDSDFCTGSIARCLFVNCGSDAIDVSGSVFEVADTRIEGTGDKGMSAGEDSHRRLGRP